MPDEVRDIFYNRYVNINSPVEFVEAHYVQNNGIDAKVTIKVNGSFLNCEAHGNGRFDAVCNAIRERTGFEYSIKTYKEHALETSSKSQAAAYVGIEDEKTGKVFWGAGINTDIISASVSALISAINRINAENK